MLTNVPPILVRMEPSVQTLTETTSVLVTTDLLERTVIKVRKIILVTINSSVFYWIYANLIGSSTVLLRSHSSLA